MEDSREDQRFEWRRRKRRWDWRCPQVICRFIETSGFDQRPSEQEWRQLGGTWQRPRNALAEQRQSALEVLRQKQRTVALSGQAAGGLFGMAKSRGAVACFQRPDRQSTVRESGSLRAQSSGC